MDKIKTNIEILDKQKDKNDKLIIETVEYLLNLLSIKTVKESITSKTDIFKKNDKESIKNNIETKNVSNKKETCIATLKNGLPCTRKQKTEQYCMTHFKMEIKKKKEAAKQDEENSETVHVSPHFTKIFNFLANATIKPKLLFVESSIAKTLDRVDFNNIGKDHIVVPSSSSSNEGFLLHSTRRRLSSLTTNNTVATSKPLLRIVRFEDRSVNLTEEEINMLYYIYDFDKDDLVSKIPIKLNGLLEVIQ